VNAINAGGVPTISSAWDSVVKIEGAKALEKAIELYEKQSFFLFLFHFRILHLPPKLIFITASKKKTMKDGKRN